MWIKFSVSLELHNSENDVTFTSQLYEKIIRPEQNQSDVFPPFNAFSASGTPKVCQCDVIAQNSAPSITLNLLPVLKRAIWFMWTTHELKTSTGFVARKEWIWRGRSASRAMGGYSAEIKWEKTDKTDVVWIRRIKQNYKCFSSRVSSRRDSRSVSVVAVSFYTPIQPTTTTQLETTCPTHTRGGCHPLVCREATWKRRPRVSVTH